MNILEDKFLTNVCEQLKTQKRINRKSNVMPLKLYFICGKEFDKSKRENRSLLRDLIEKSDINAKCIFAEEMYFDDLEYNLLQFENVLANISEKIIIILESPGTFCELGAFVNVEESKSKLIVINEDNPNYDNSFITKGPLQLVNKENSLVKFQGELIKHPEVKKLIKNLANNSITPLKPNLSSEIELKSLICELLHLFYMFCPICKFELEKLYKNIYEIKEIKIKESNKHGMDSIDKVIKLMIKLDLIRYRCGYYILSDNLSITKPLFKNNDEGKIRTQYLARLYKKDKNRLKCYDN